MTVLDAAKALAGKARLTAVPCALCGHPVSHQDGRVVGALAGGLCGNHRDKEGRREKVFTFVRQVACEHI